MYSFHALITKILLEKKKNALNTGNHLRVHESGKNENILKQIW